MVSTVTIVVIVYILMSCVTYMYLAEYCVHTQIHTDTLFCPVHAGVMRNLKLLVHLPPPIFVCLDEQWGGGWLSLC